MAALRERLAPGGRLLVTVPAGYNPAFDAALREGAIASTRSAALRRTGAGDALAAGRAGRGVVGAV